MVAMHILLSNSITRKNTMACTTVATALYSPVHRVLLPIVMLLSICRPAASFQYAALTSVSRKIQPRHSALVTPYSWHSRREQTTNSRTGAPGAKQYRWWPPLTSSSSSSSSQETDSPPAILPSALAAPRAEDSPWTDPQLAERRKELRERTTNARERNKHNRFRQHVNPLSSKYQTPTVLTENWPASSYTDLSKPLHLDIGCGKGGFLLDMAVSDAAKSYNYLGLEIRPLVASYARERVVVHEVTGHLDYIGCNANVDLRRILQRYHQQQHSDDATDTDTDSSSPQLQLQRVSIQFPDPHYKSKRAKRRVVTRELVNTLAASMPTDGIIFLQSDVQSMLDDMRNRFRESPVYFRDSLEDVTSYVPDNMMGVATEREVSVLKQDLPIYRSVFTRTAEPYVTEDSELPTLEL